MKGYRSMRYSACTIVSVAHLRQKRINWKQASANNSSMKFPTRRWWAINYQCVLLMHYHGKNHGKNQAHLTLSKVGLLTFPFSKHVIVLSCGRLLPGDFSCSVTIAPKLPVRVILEFLFYLLIITCVRKPWKLWHAKRTASRSCFSSTMTTRLYHQILRSGEVSLWWRVRSDDFVLAFGLLPLDALTAIPMFPSLGYGDALVASLRAARKIREAHCKPCCQQKYDTK
jgi:hypothetical protein